MWKLRSCPRCSGDIFISTDEEHRWYEQCLQCGYVQELKKVTEFYEHQDERERETILVGENRRRRRSPSQGDTVKADVD